MKLLRFWTLLGNCFRPFCTYQEFVQNAQAEASCDNTNENDGFTLMTFYSDIITAIIASGLPPTLLDAWEAQRADDTC